eukprot:CAMPEP_0202963362 /NCGR_PEP_ID=MMETSP1396-20130829/7352_1 /ASSEMBLY_ACC=CAM_ASM_000872 /TAXON_ID= /ORGANISM="Pseudokeronopsis sp., Strain Brazil" /LENGTH=134 /DNA_ID=CAMNT_0049684507 /DNA_START=114 /DNA_END=518 /DNA_ORIENTATION=+
MLETVGREIEKCNSLIKEAQFEIKRAPKEKEKELNDQLNQIRVLVNEWEENVNEKKKKFKYEIQLNEELKKLQDIENIDPENVDVEVFEKAGIQLPNAGPDGKVLKITSSAFYNQENLDLALKKKDSKKEETGL